MTEIRTLREDDRQELIGFLKRQFPKRDQLSAESFFTWRYQRNPLGDGQASIYLACQQGQIVGCMGAIADRLWDGHAWHDCQWLVDLIIKPECRGGLDVLRLFQHALARSELTVATGVGPHLLRLYRALEWRQLAVCDTLYFPLRPVGLAKLARDIAPRHRWISWALPAAALASLAWKPMATWVCNHWHTGSRVHPHSNTKASRDAEFETPSTPASQIDDCCGRPNSPTSDWASRAASPIDHPAPVEQQTAVSISSPTPRAASLAIPSGPVRPRPIERFDDRIDGLVDQLLPALGVTVFRSQQSLNWKFVDRPCGTHFLWLLEDERTGRLRGHVAAKLMHRPGVAKWVELGDYLIHPDDHDAWLKIVGLLGSIAVEHRCDFVRLWLSNPQHIAALRRAFWIHKRMHVSEDVFIYSRDHQLLERLSSSPWHLTAIVSDRCDYGRDEVS